MVILHIAYVHANPFSGVVRAVPQHVIAQQKIADVAYINITNIADNRIEHQFKYEAKMRIRELPKPFNKPDIVVFHEVYHLEFLKFTRELISRKIPYVIIPHGCMSKEAQRKKKFKKIAANILIFNRFIHHSAALQYLSSLEKRQSISKRRCFIGTNGVNLPVDRKERFNQKIVKLVFVGRIDIQIKGLDLLFSSIEQLKHLLMNNKCFFTLYGPSYKNSADMAKELIQKHKVENIISVEPPISGEAKSSVLLEADAYIQTSRTEGMPMGILEALSYGVPCIVTQGTNMKETIESHNAGWGASNDIESISNAICRFLEERDSWGEKSTNARKLIEEEYAWPVVAERTIYKYQNLLDQIN